jgi:hypothetical protein
MRPILPVVNHLGKLSHFFANSAVRNTRGTVVGGCRSVKDVLGDYVWRRCSGRAANRHGCARPARAQGTANRRLRHLNVDMYVIWLLRLPTSRVPSAQTAAISWRAMLFVLLCGRAHGALRASARPIKGITSSSGVNGLPTYLFIPQLAPAPSRGASDQQCPKKPLLPTPWPTSPRAC